MNKVKVNSVTLVKIIGAFAIVYLVWGSTYFFIQRAIHSFPPFLLGAIRFLAASVLMLGWCIYKKEKVFVGSQIRHAIIAGLFLLFVGNGAVIWVEQYLPSAAVAIMVSSSPLWFVILDWPKWSENLHSRSTVVGLIIGFAGVFLLFYKSLLTSFAGVGHGEVGGMIIVTIAAISWSGGSLYSKYFNNGTPAVVNSTWQMFAAGIAFAIGSLLRGEQYTFDVNAVSSQAWGAVAYLVVFGSIAGFSAYVWLLQVRPATQVSTYAYVNPVVAVLLGVLFAGEHISLLQIAGLAVILLSVMLINFAKYRRSKLQVRTIGQ